MHKQGKRPRAVNPGAEARGNERIGENEEETKLFRCLFQSDLIEQEKLFKNALKEVQFF